MESSDTLHHTFDPCQHLSQWTPPVEWCKLNFDDSVNMNSGVSGIGGIIRQHSGQMIVAYSSHINKADPLDAG